MKKLMLSFTILMAVIIAFAFNAQATTIYGQLSFSGTFQSDNPELNLATVFEDFSDVVVSSAGGTFDYDPIPGNTPVSLTTFTFDPNVGVISNPEINNFWVIEHENITYSYDLLTSEIQFAAPDSIVVSGTGWASITEFEDTSSIWTLSATIAGTSSTFTLSTLVPPDYQPQGPNPIPEPTTMVLFGIGLLGLAGLTRKKN